MTALAKGSMAGGCVRRPSSDVGPATLRAACAVAWCPHVVRYRKCWQYYQMPRDKNPYTQLAGYKFAAPDHGNGCFVVFDRGKLGVAWYSELPKHRWLVKKMPDGKTQTRKNLDDAKQLAIISARTVHPADKWWL